MLEVFFSGPCRPTPALAQCSSPPQQATNARDHLLDCLSTLTNLEQLSLGSCQLLGAGLVHLAACSGLKTLFLSTCETMEDLALVHLAATCPALDRLHGAYCSFSDRGVVALASGCTDLSYVDLRGTALTDDGLGALLGLSRLGHLNLARCTQVTGSGLAGAVAPLVSVSFLGCRALEAANLAYLAAIPTLETLNISDTGVDATALDHVGACTSLQHLAIRHNAAIPPSALASLVGLVRLTSLHAGGGGDDDDQEGGDAPAGLTGYAELAALPRLRSLEVEEHSFCLGDLRAILDGGRLTHAVINRCPRFSADVAALSAEERAALVDSFPGRLISPGLPRRTRKGR